MIVIFVDLIENFLQFLDSRLMHQVFYELKEVKGESTDLSSDIEISIILHFLSKVDEYLTLYETRLDLRKPNNSNIDEEVIKELQKIFNKVDPPITLVKGKIREIFLSYSS